MSPQRKVLAEALALADDERAELARELLESLEDAVELRTGDVAELKRRLLELEQGEGISFPSDEAFLSTLS